MQRPRRIAYLWQQLRVQVRRLMGGLYHLHVLFLESELATNPTLLVKRVD